MIGIMTTSIDLVDMLKEEIEKIVSEFTLNCNIEGRQKSPQVTTQYLPEKENRSKMIRIFHTLLFGLLKKKLNRDKTSLKFISLQEHMDMTLKFVGVTW